MSLLIAVGTASLAIYLGLALLGDLRAHLGLYLAAHGLLVALYAAAVRIVTHQGPGGLFRRQRRAAEASTRRAPFGAPDDSAVTPQRCRDERPHQGRHGKTKEGVEVTQRAAALAVTIATFAVAFRAALLFTSPSLSGDLHRYVWDGRVQVAGVNPYRFPPDAAELSPLRDASWKSINHSGVRTIYPPLSEALFLGAAAAGLRETGFKALFCVFDLGVALALARLLSLSGRSPLWAVVYAWNPLAIVEVASSGHLDPLGILLLVVATGFIVEDRRSASILSYAGAILARLVPLALLPIVVRRFRARHLLLGAGVVVAGIAPYARAGRALFSGLGIYAENWDFNAIVFPALRVLLERTVPVEALKDLITAFKDAIGDPAWCQILYAYVWPAPLARTILAASLLAGMVVVSFRIVAISREMLFGVGLVLVLTPTLHPWYLLWILPFAAVESSVPWIVFTALAPLSYLSLRTPDGRCPAWVLAVEWGIPAAVAVAGVWRRAAIGRERG